MTLSGQSAIPPLISVVVPIYRTEAQVERCVRSIMNQTLRAIEIICVDDASPDKSAAIVENLAAQDDRVRLIRHACNRGIGASRNTAIAAARGAFITGVDSDDWIEPEMLETLWLAGDKGAADIVVCGFMQVDDAGVRTGSVYAPERRRVDTALQPFDIFDGLKYSVWGKIWRKSLFVDNGIRFPEKTYYQDLAVAPRLAWFARDIRFIDDVFYHYLVRPGSVTNSYSAKHIVDYFQVFEILEQFLVQEGLTERYGARLIDTINANLHYHASLIAFADIPETQKQQYVRLMLTLQAGFLDYKDRLRDAKTDQLRTLIRHAKSRKALDARLSTGAGSGSFAGTRTAEAPDG